MAAKKIDPSTEDTDSVNWWEVERKFVHSHLSGTAFAVEEGLDYGVLKKRASRGNWAGKRKAFLARLSEELDANEIERRKRIAAELDDDAAEAAKKAMAKAAVLIDDAATTSQLKAGVDALTKAYRLAREANGLPAEKEPTPEVRTDGAFGGITFTPYRDEHGELYAMEPVSGAVFYQRDRPGDPREPHEWVAEAADQNTKKAAARKLASDNSDAEPFAADPSDGRADAPSVK